MDKFTELPFSVETVLLVILNDSLPKNSVMTTLEDSCLLKGYKFSSSPTYTTLCHIVSKPKILPCYTLEFTYRGLKYPAVVTN